MEQSLVGITMKHSIILKPFCKSAKLIGVFAAALFLNGCSQTPNEVDTAATPYTEMVAMPEENLHQHMIYLANDLFSTSKELSVRYPIAVGTFLPIKHIDGKSLPQEVEIGHLIQESFVTLGAQAGLNVIEFKTMPAIQLTEGQDIMLSRDIAVLNKEFNAKYYLTGTYSEQNNSLIVNARIIDISTLSVKAAATRYMPLDIAATQNKLSLKNNMIYRNIQ